MRKNVFPPGTATRQPFDSKMKVEKDVIDELLLVCGVIGTTTGEDNQLVPVTDCLNWLQDLQRALRRDDDLYRPISLLMAKWKVVEQKLLPLVLTSRHDTAIVLTVIKILVILTKPLADATRRAGRMIIDSSSKGDVAVISQQIQLRENALEQAQLLLDYKRLIAHHPSHHAAKQGTGLLSVFVSLLAEPLSRSGASRSDGDHLTIELIFHLFRNLLAAEPLLNSKCRLTLLVSLVFRQQTNLTFYRSIASSDTSRQSNQLHHELIVLFDKEDVLEIILVLGQEMESRENAQYNLLMMELLHHLLKTQDPAAVALVSSHFKSTLPPKSSILASKLKEEQTRRHFVAASRHGHFGGTWMKQRSDGDISYVPSARRRASNHEATIAKRKNRKAEPFIGSGRALLSHCRNARNEDGPTTKRASQSLNKFCRRFINDCYGPVMKSLKNEFRRDSHRLEATDKVVFFRIVWFFCHWWRHSQATRRLGQLIFTMDVFTFSLVLTSTDTFYQLKSYTRLAQAVALYSEMMHLLLDMYSSKDETEMIMARGLLDRLFYGAEPLDRLPKLLNRWTPGLYTREYLCDLVELCHVSLKLLDTNQRDCKDLLQNSTHTKSERIEKLRSAAAQFDVKGYFCRKIVSNHLISMFTHLLGQYKLNSAHVNNRILAMFLRMARTHVTMSDIPEEGVPFNTLSGRAATLEPMLFNIHLIVTAGKILSDASVNTDDENFREVLVFCTNLYNHFLEESRKNPLLFVECLFRHPAPHRFCELFSNMYVSEELRMIAEREVLLDEHHRYEQDLAGSFCDRSLDHDEDDAENEFDIQTEELSTNLNESKPHSMSDKTGKRKTVAITDEESTEKRCKVHDDDLTADDREDKT